MLLHKHLFTISHLSAHSKKEFFTFILWELQLFDLCNCDKKIFLTSEICTKNLMFWVNFTVVLLFSFNSFANVWLTASDCPQAFIVHLFHFSTELH